MTVPRNMQIIAEVGSYWSAYDAGRLAHAVGMRRDENQWDTDLTRTHVNCADWWRGWDAESSCTQLQE